MPTGVLRHPADAASVGCLRARAHPTLVAHRLGGGKSRRYAVLRIVAGARIRPRLLERSPTPLPPVRKPQARARGIRVALNRYRIGSPGVACSPPGDFATGCPLGRLGVARESQRFPGVCACHPRLLTIGSVCRQEAPSASAGNTGGTPPCSTPLRERIRLWWLTGSGAAKVAATRSCGLSPGRGSARGSSSVRRPPCLRPPKCHLAAPPKADALEVSGGAAAASHRAGGSQWATS